MQLYKMELYKICHKKMTIFSAGANTSYQAVIFTLLAWSAPLIMILLCRDGIVYLIASMQPMMLMRYDNVMETSRYYELQMGATAVIAFLCVYSGRRRWKRMEME